MKLTKEQIKNIENARWRLTHLYKIRTKHGTVEFFNPNKVQEEYLANETNQDIILKSRQAGISTLKLIQLLDRTMFKANTTSVILAHKKEVVQKLFRIIKFAYDNYPSEYPKPDAKYDNKNELYFAETNSTIYVTTDVRGDTIHNLHISEMAFIKNAEEKYVATKAAIVPGGRITIESTANGIGNFFYDFFNEAEQRGFKPHFYPWYYTSEYVLSAKGMKFEKDDIKMKGRYNLSDEQLSWYVANHKDFKDKMLQEYPSNPLEAFITSGNNVFPVTMLNNIEACDPKGVDQEGMAYWEEPEYGHTYVIGIDVANEGLDETAVDIIDTVTGHQVAHWSGKILVPFLAEKLQFWARRWRDATLVPEINNHGFALMNMLREMRPKLKMYKREKFDGFQKKTIKKLGWLTTVRSKAMMVQHMNDAIYKGDILIRNEKTLLQLKTFVQDLESGKMAAAPGKKDDCVMSIMLAWEGVLSRPTGNVAVVDAFNFTGEGDGIMY